MTFPDRYPIEETSSGFRIHSETMEPITVTFNTTHIAVEYIEEGIESCHRYGFFDYQRLVTDISKRLTRNWRRPPGKPNWERVEKWVKGRKARAVNKRLYPHWQSRLQEVDPLILEVHCAMYRATRRISPVAFSPALYRRHYLVSDIVNYRAAAIAATHLPTLVGGRGPDPTPIEEYLPRLGHWKGLFSPSGESYRSLNRTLMNLPGGIGLKPLKHLQRFELHRPYTQRLELLTITSYFGCRREDCLNERVFRNASAEQIRRAFTVIGERKWRSQRDIYQAVQNLADYPEPHRGNIVGLAKRSLRWHRSDALRAERASHIQKTHGADTALPKPPITLPSGPRIRFLSTVEEVCDEGLSMEHCIAQYAEKALEGRCYLFHVDYQGDKASIEVDPWGEVKQAQGPRNQPNQATAWGERALSKWGESFLTTINRST